MPIYLSRPFHVENRTRWFHYWRGFDANTLNWYWRHHETFIHISGSCWQRIRHDSSANIFLYFCTFDFRLISQKILMSLKTFYPNFILKFFSRGDAYFNADVANIVIIVFGLSFFSKISFIRSYAYNWSLIYFPLREKVLISDNWT